MEKHNSLYPRASAIRLEVKSQVVNMKLNIIFNYSSPVPHQAAENFPPTFTLCSSCVSELLLACYPAVMQFYQAAVFPAYSGGFFFHSFQKSMANTQHLSLLEWCSQQEMQKELMKLTFLLLK